jgi:PAS domain S-box-containing protein
LTVPGERPWSGTVIVRDWKVWMASEGAAALVGRAPPALSGIPFLDLIAPEHRTRVAERYERRLRGDLVPSEYETVLLRSDGERITVELLATREGTDVVVQLRDVSAQAARRPLLDALAALGAAIPRERSEAEVMARVRQALPGIGLTPLLMRAAPEGVRVEWADLPAALLATFAEGLGRPLAGFLGRWSPFSRAAWEEGIAFSDDWPSEVSAFMPEQHAEAARALVTGHGLTRAVAARLDERQAARFYLVLVGGWLRAQDVPAMRLFAAQVAAALDVAQTISDLSRRLSDLEAVHALAQRIFSNAPGDVQGLLDDGCRAAAGALGCRGAAVLLAEEEGRVLRAAAVFGVPLDPARIRIPVERDGLAAEAIRTGAPACSEDVTRDPRSAMCGNPNVPPLSMMAVPLVSRAATRGVLFLGDGAGRSFSPAERALANALGGELAVGLENAELYAEARSRLSELSTVIDVARVVSSSLDLEEVLLAGAEHLKQTLRASGCTILLDDVRRHELRRAAFRGAPIGPPTVPLAERSLARGALDARAPVSSRDGGAGGEAALAVPLHVRDQPVGVALIAASAGRRFSPGELSRAMAIASQLAVAVDNARLYQETRRRAEELGLLHEVGRSLVATLDIEQVLDTGVRNLARMVDVPLALLALATGDGALEVRAVWGGSARLIGRRVPLDDGASAEARRMPAAVEDARTEPHARQELLAGIDARAYLALPLLVRDRLIGSAVMIDTRQPRRFGPAEVERAAAIANQLAAAAENARLYEDLRESYAELARAQRQLIQQERLAALGELSAVVAHEVRNPLGVIFNSLGSLRRLLRPEGDARLLLDIVGEEADRLNRIVGDLLDFARPSTPVLRPERLDRVVDEAVAAALAQDPPAIEVRREVAPDLPPVPMDARLVRQAVLNVAANAVQAMGQGGRLTVRVRREEAGVVLELEDTGPGMPEEVRSRIFEPFFTTKASGTGLGLAVVKRIVDGHSAEISVQSRVGEGTTFRIRFPLRAEVVMGPGIG